jgi:RHS repeat-associated protein
MDPFTHGARDEWDVGLLATIEPTAVNTNGTRYTTSDTLGSPRVVTSSSAGVVSRHDYKPFGEELFNGGRTVGMGYGAADGLRTQFTSKERDNETGLDYFLARYYSPTQGRFTSPDEFTGGPDELFDFSGNASDNPTFYADLADPQSLNKYAYAFNNPLSFIDPDGHQGQGKKTLTERLKDGARSVGKTLERTANGAASAISENNGLGPMDAEQNSVGRVIGHGLTAVQVGVEIYAGVQAMTAGGGSLTLTLPACGTGVGCAATAASVGTIGVGATVTTHGALVGINTVNNIFSKKTELSKQKKDYSVEGTTEQSKGLDKAQQAAVKDARGSGIKQQKVGDKTKTKQNAKTADRRYKEQYNKKNSQ